VDDVRNLKHRTSCDEGEVLFSNQKLAGSDRSLRPCNAPTC